MADIFGALKKRLRGKSEKDAELSLDRLTLESLVSLKTRLAADQTADLSPDFSRLVKEFFQKLFKIKYQFTYEELISEITRKRFTDEMKKEMIEYIQGLTHLEYSPGGMSRIRLLDQIGLFENLVIKATSDSARPHKQEKEPAKPAAKRMFGKSAGTQPKPVPKENLPSADKQLKPATSKKPEMQVGPKPSLSASRKKESLPKEEEWTIPLPPVIDEQPVPGGKTRIPVSPRPTLSSSKKKEPLPKEEEWTIPLPPVIDEHPQPAAAEKPEMPASPKSVFSLFRKKEPQAKDETEPLLMPPLIDDPAQPAASGKPEAPASPKSVFSLFRKKEPQVKDETEPILAPPDFKEQSKQPSAGKTPDKTPAKPGDRLSEIYSLFNKAYDSVQKKRPIDARDTLVKIRTLHTKLDRKTQGQFKDEIDHLSQEITLLQKELAEKAKKLKTRPAEPSLLSQFLPPPSLDDMAEGNLAKGKITSAEGLPPIPSLDLRTDRKMPEMPELPSFAPPKPATSKNPGQSQPKAAGKPKPFKEEKQLPRIEKTDAFTIFHARPKEEPPVEEPAPEEVIKVNVLKHPIKKKPSLPLPAKPALDSDIGDELEPPVLPKLPDTLLSSLNIPGDKKMPSSEGALKKEEIPSLLTPKPFQEEKPRFRLFARPQKEEKLLPELLAKPLVEEKPKRGLFAKPQKEEKLLPELPAKLMVEEKPKRGLFAKPQKEEKPLPELPAKPLVEEKPKRGLFARPQKEEKLLPELSAKLIVEEKPKRGLFAKPQKEEKPLPELPAKPLVEEKRKPGLFAKPVKEEAPPELFTKPVAEKKPLPELFTRPAKAEKPLPEAPGEPIAEKRPLPELPAKLMVEEKPKRGLFARPQKEEKPLPELPVKPIAEEKPKHGLFAKPVKEEKAPPELFTKPVAEKKPLPELFARPAKAEKPLPEPPAKPMVEKRPLPELLARPVMEEEAPPELPANPLKEEKPKPGLSLKPDKVKVPEKPALPKTPPPPPRIKELLEKRTAPAPEPQTYPRKFTFIPQADMREEILLEPPTLALDNEAVGKGREAGTLLEKIEGKPQEKTPVKKEVLPPGQSAINGLFAQRPSAEKQAGAKTREIPPVPPILEMPKMKHDIITKTDKKLLIVILGLIKDMKDALSEKDIKKAEDYLGRITKAKSALSYSLAEKMEPLIDAVNSTLETIKLESASAPVVQKPAAPKLPGSGDHNQMILNIIRGMPDFSAPQPEEIPPPAPIQPQEPKPAPLERLSRNELETRRAIQALSDLNQAMDSAKDLLRTSRLDEAKEAYQRALALKKLIKVDEAEKNRLTYELMDLNVAIRMAKVR